MGGLGHGHRHHRHRIHVADAVEADATTGRRQGLQLGYGLAVVGGLIVAAVLNTATRLRPDPMVAAGGTVMLAKLATVAVALLTITALKAWRTGPCHVTIVTVYTW